MSAVEHKDFVRSFRRRGQFRDAGINGGLVLGCRGVTEALGRFLLPGFGLCVGWFVLCHEQAHGGKGEGGNEYGSFFHERFFGITVATLRLKQQSKAPFLRD